MDYGKISMLLKLPNTDELNYMQVLINKTINERRLLSILHAVKYAEFIYRRAISEIVWIWLI